MKTQKIKNIFDSIMKEDFNFSEKQIRGVLAERALDVLKIEKNKIAREQFPLKKK